MNFSFCIADANMFNFFFLTVVDLPLFKKRKIIKSKKLNYLFIHIFLFLYYITGVCLCKQSAIKKGTLEGSGVGYTPIRKEVGLDRIHPSKRQIIKALDMLEWNSLGKRGQKCHGDLLKDKWGSLGCHWWIIQLLINRKNGVFLMLCGYE